MLHEPRESVSVRPWSLQGVAAAGLLLITLVVCLAQHQERYFLSVAFGLLFVGLSDPGGAYLHRLRRLAVVSVIGGLLTALGFGIGGDPWGWVVLATFVVTVVSGLVINFDLQAFVAGILLNAWFLICLATVTGLPAAVTPHPWNQALAWLIGAGIWIVFTFVLWLVRGRVSRPSPLPEIPADMPVKLTRPIVSFILIRAFRGVSRRCHCLRAESTERRLDAGRHPDRHEDHSATIQPSGGTASCRRSLGRWDRLRLFGDRYEQKRLGGSHHRSHGGRNVHPRSELHLLRGWDCRVRPHRLGPSPSHQPGRGGATDLLHVRRGSDCSGRHVPRHTAPEAQGLDPGTDLSTTSFHCSSTDNLRLPPNAGTEGLRPSQIGRTHPTRHWHPSCSKSSSHLNSTELPGTRSR